MQYLSDVINSLHTINDLEKTQVISQYMLNQIQHRLDDNFCYNQGETIVDTVVGLRDEYENDLAQHTAFIYNGRDKVYYIGPKDAVGKAILDLKDYLSKNLLGDTILEADEKDLAIDDSELPF